MAQELGPEAERRLILKHFALTEVELRRLKKMAASGDEGAEEARWLITHEDSVHAKWLGLRTAFILLDVFGPPPKPKFRNTQPTGTTAAPRPGTGRSMTGDRIG